MRRPPHAHVCLCIHTHTHDLTRTFCRHRNRRREHQSSLTATKNTDAHAFDYLFHSTFVGHQSIVKITMIIIMMASTHRLACIINNRGQIPRNTSCTRHARETNHSHTTHTHMKSLYLFRRAVAGVWMLSLRFLRRRLASRIMFFHTHSPVDRRFDAKHGYSRLLHKFCVRRLAT